MVARTCAPSGRTGCGSRSGTVPHADQRRLCCKSSCHKSTSMTVNENGVTKSGGRAMPPTGSTGGKSHIPS